MNKTPAELAPFRRGTFAQAVKYHAPIYGIAMSGASDCWPLKAKTGGYPSTVKVQLRKLMTPSGADDVASVAEECRRLMQQTVDALAADSRRGKKGGDAYPVREAHQASSENEALME